MSDHTSTDAPSSGAPVAPAPPLKTNSRLAGSGSGSLRSASIASSNFFTSTPTSTTSVDQPSVNGGESADDEPTGASLDIVGALGNLNLDEEFVESATKDTSVIAADAPVTSGDIPKSTTPFTTGPAVAASQQHQQFWDHSYHHPPAHFYSPYPPQGSLTPNIGGSGGAGGAGDGNGSTSTSSFAVKTPSNTWSNSFIPASAPPFMYSGEQDLSSLSIKPFELPGDDTEGQSSHHHQQQQQHLPPFGLNGLYFHDGLRDAPFIKEGSIAPEGEESTHPQHTNFTNMFQPEFMPFKGLASNNALMGVGAVTGGSGGAGTGAGPVGGVGGVAGSTPTLGGMSLPPQLMDTTNMWNQYGGINQQPVDNVASSLGGYKNNHVNSTSPHPSNNSNNPNNHNHHHHHHNNNNNHNNGHSNRFNGHSHRNRNQYTNDGMNVHRKMHNNNNNTNHHKRKGDDASKYANAKLEDFSGEIYSLCKDQHGCRFLQRQLDLGRENKTESGGVLSSEIAATMIFNEIYLKIIELMTDPFGNYLIQKLFENVSTDQRIILVKNASPEFIRIALDPHGTRALQKLVECITTEEESKLIIDSLSPHIVSLSRDLNGNHVVQKCLQRLKPEDNQFIFDTASLHCNEIATHRHGCCVLQRCLDHGNAKQRQQLSFKVAENATNLSLDPFGNYVVQYVLSRGDEESIKNILQHIKLNVISLSLHKFGSNVIEKSLRINKLTDSLVEVLLLNKERFSEMLNDAYGNYVLQTSLEVANAEDLAKLSGALHPLLPNIKNTPHGRRIMTKIQSL
ncbi:pumilio homology domain family member 4 [[Candida] anglica]|uniref:Pumilio homology domain family member 4 n=1 Tax=[Candida] anglica TaxID=148631 RepID=A0ABP0EI01_9ASCO